MESRVLRSGKKVVKKTNAKKSSMGPKEGAEKTLKPGLADNVQGAVSIKGRNERKKRDIVADEGVNVAEVTNVRKKMYGIKVRTTPYPLYNVLKEMTEAQLNCIREMGFGGLIGMKMDGIPANLGMYVVRNFNPCRMVLKTSSGEILITQKVIEDALGAPRGPLGFESITLPDHGLASMGKWMEQFDKPIVCPTDVTRQIVLSNEADWNFKLNFLVVFTNTMARCKGNGLCDLTVLSKVTPETRVQDMNFCEYVYNCLMYCKNQWSGESAFFCGPLATLVLVYVDYIKWDIPCVKRVRPIIKGWSSDLLRMRVDSEIDAGGLGLADLAGAYVKDDDTPTTPDSVEEYVKFFESTYQKIEELKRSFCGEMEKALVRFNGDKAIEEWKVRGLSMNIVSNNASGGTGDHMTDRVIMDIVDDIGGGASSSHPEAATCFETPTQFFSRQDVTDDFDDTVRGYLAKRRQLWSMMLRLLRSKF